MSVAVSVVIPAYNREDVIGPAIESVLRQTYADFELIIVDDCSADATAARASAIADPRVSVLRHPENRGVSAARNTGIRAARGRYVAFQDSDDEWLPTKLSKQVAVLEADPTCVAAYCGMVIVRDPVPAVRTRASVSYVPAPGLEGVDGQIFEALLRQSFVSTQTLVARREALDAVDGFDEALTALVDWDCVLRLSMLGSIRLVDEPLVLQRFSANSITFSQRRRVEARMRIIDKQRAALAARPRVLAAHLASIAGGWRRLGDAGAARSHALRAIAAAPLTVEGWRAIAAVVLDQRDEAAPE